MKEKEIHKICWKYNIRNYTINPDGSIDVDGDVLLSHKDLTKLPLTFNKVKYLFDCSSNHLTTLEGAPKEVGRSFDCSFNYLTSLKYVPTLIGDELNCSFNNIKTFEYIPEYLYSLCCEGNDIYDIWKQYKWETDANYYLQLLSKQDKRSKNIEKILTD